MCVLLLNTGDKVLLNDGISHILLNDCGGGGGGAGGGGRRGRGWRKTDLRMNAVPGQRELQRRGLTWPGTKTTS